MLLLWPTTREQQPGGGGQQAAAAGQKRPLVAPPPVFHCFVVRLSFEIISPPPSVGRWTTIGPPYLLFFLENRRPAAAGRRCLMAINNIPPSRALTFPLGIAANRRPPLCSLATLRLGAKPTHSAPPTEQHSSSLRHRQREALDCVLSAIRASLSLRSPPQAKTSARALAAGCQPRQRHARWPAPAGPPLRGRP